MSTCDGTRNIRAVPRRNQRHERLTKTVVTSPLRKSWPSKPNPIYTLEGLALSVLCRHAPVSPLPLGEGQGEGRFPKTRGKRELGSSSPCLKRLPAFALL